MKLVESSQALSLWQVNQFSDISYSRLQAFPAGESCWRFLCEEDIESLSSTDISNLRKVESGEFCIFIELSSSLEGLSFQRPFMKDGLQTRLKFASNKRENFKETFMKNLRIGSNPVMTQVLSAKQMEDSLDECDFKMNFYAKDRKKHHSVVNSLMIYRDEKLVASLGYTEGLFSTGEKYVEILWYGVDRQLQGDERRFCHNRLGYGLQSCESEVASLTISLQDEFSLKFFQNKGLRVDSVLIKRF